MIVPVKMNQNSIKSAVSCGGIIITDKLYSSFENGWAFVFNIGSCHHTEAVDYIELKTKWWISDKPCSFNNPWEVLGFCTKVGTIMKNKRTIIENFAEWNRANTSKRCRAINGASLYSFYPLRGQEENT